jgi:hypothetical protein
MRKVWSAPQVSRAGTFAEATKQIKRLGGADGIILDLPPLDDPEGDVTIGITSV